MGDVVLVLATYALALMAIVIWALFWPHIEQALCGRRRNSIFRVPFCYLPLFVRRIILRFFHLDSQLRYER